MQYQLGKTSWTWGLLPKAVSPPTSDRDGISVNDIEDGRAIAKLAGTHFNPECDVCVCRKMNGERQGGYLYTDYTRESISMHSASWTTRWLNRDMVFIAFDYPFRQLRVKRIFGQTPEDNLPALEFNRKCGFKVIARIEGVYEGGVACIVTRMEPEDCRLLHVRPTEGIQRWQRRAAHLKHPITAHS